MKFKAHSVLLLLGGLWPARASADNRFIVRTTLDLQTLQTVCNPPLLPPLCTVVQGLGDPLGQLFLITSPLSLGDLLDLPGNPLEIVRAEVDQLLNLFPVGALNVLPSPLPADLMSDRTAVPYPNSGGTRGIPKLTHPPHQKVRAQVPMARLEAMARGMSGVFATAGVPRIPGLRK